MHSPAVRERALALIHSGLNDCEVARRTGISRTTIRDWRRPRYQPRGRDRVICPRCWLMSPRMSFDAGDYAELLSLYLGDGHIVRLARTWRFRLFLDSRYEEIVDDSRALLKRCFPGQTVGTIFGHEGRMTVLSVYYLSYGFSNYSSDILDLFCHACDGLGLEYRRYARSVRINRRSSVARLEDKIGVKR